MTTLQIFKIFIIAAIWGGSHVLVRIVVPALGPTLTVFSRIAIAAFTLYFIMRAKKETLNLGLNRPHFLAIGACNFAFPMFLFSYAAVHLPATYLAILNATMPMFNAIFSVWLLSEPFGLKRAMGMVLGFSGVLLLKEFGSIQHFDFLLLTGLLAGLIASASYGFGSVYVKKWASKINPLKLTAGSSFFGAMLLAPMAAVSLFTPSAVAPPPYHPLVLTASLLILGMLGSGYAFVLFYGLVQEIGALRTSTVTFLMPLFGMFWGYLFLNEEITHGMMLGALLVIGSAFLFLKKPKTPAA